MKKIMNYKYVLFALVISLSITSCQVDDSTMEGKVKPVLTAVGPTSITVNEGNDAVLNFQLDKAINKPIQYRLVMLDESTAVDMDDYVIPGCRSNDPDCVAIEENGGPVGYIFEIPAYATEYSVNIQTILDDLTEGDETLRLKVVSNRTLLGTVDNLFFDITIKNTASDDLSILLKWDGMFDSAGVSVAFCDLDMDLEIYDSSSAQPILSSYDGCPEKIVLSSTLPDDSYILIASFWDNVGYTDTVNLPAMLTFYKGGSNFSETLDLTSSFPVNMGGINNGNDNAYRFFTITKVGTTFTIKDETDVLVAEGRHANLIKSFKRNASKKRILKLKK